MTIIALRKPSESDFTVVANTLAQDNALTLRARGLFLYLFSLPDGWETSVDRLAGQVPEGRDAVRAAVRELEAGGYLIRRQSSDGRASWRHEWEMQGAPLSPSAINPSLVSNDGLSADDTSATEKGSNSREYEVQSTEVETPSPPSGESPPLREDVEALCQRLRGRIVANGCRAPRITSAWRRDTRLMLDKDGRSPEQIAAVIDWATEHLFWRTHVFSPGKIREKWDAMRLDAEAQRARPRRLGAVAQARAVMERTKALAAAEAGA